MTNNDTARANILERIRAGKPAPEDAPQVPAFGWPGDAVANFKAQLKGFDGNFLEFSGREEAVKWLEDNLDKASKVICSAIPDYKGTVSPADYPDPHKCTNIDICVGQGLMGVGEMGSVLVTDESLGKPACALLCTDLYLLLDKTTIVDGMHAAYAADIIGPHAYASFFSGPSATADIEAVHVTGAQAEISLTVLLY